jgi:mxaK protein
MQVREGVQPGQAIPLIELAKETYREVLRHDPGQWNARYNLERAQRLLPDAEEGDGGPPDVPRNAERAATTMRGYSPGLP